MNLDLRTLLRYARRWWWLLLLGPIIAGGSAYWTSSQQQPMYSATSTLLISQSDPSQQDLSGLQAGERLGSTYQQLVNTDPVLQAVIDRLQLPLTIADLRGSVSASVVTGTQLLRVSVSDSDPARAARIADAVAEEFSVVISQRSTQLSSGSREALQTQITGTQQQIADLTLQIQQLEAAEAAGATDVSSQLGSLRVTLTQAQIVYGDLLSQQGEMELAEASLQSRVSVWEQARVPTAPYEPRTLLYTLLAVIAGLIIAAASVFLLEYLDNTVKNEEDVVELAGVPMLSEIRVVPKLAQGRDQLFVLNRPTSAASEAVRLLRTNLEFAAASKEITVLLVSSAGPSEGKSTVTANLAAAIAGSGLVTVVVDADLRRPTQHRIFDIPNDRGLTSLLTHPQQPWNWAAAEVIPGRLFVVPSGPQPPNPSDLLSTERMRRLLADMRSTADLVIVDTPPLLAAADALVLAPHTDGVVLLCRAGATRREALKRAVGKLQHGSIRVIGTVLNGQRSSSEAGYYYAEYYSTEPPAASPRPDAPAREHAPQA
ncbi:MAG: Tyrosine-protein kinase [uncultured Thermomicrobiales bacterium]|uniref:Tyrosine-protein kinase n=1 Tax=uncultured Thermomicrobiales bacterium TaxID=1645740 RepID=A0A6J4UI39_9BACT|nr:MAG: Tyrosine-protein kinase [uncultured Thermomicrobiales bacterium]